MIERMIRAAKLDASLYEEVEADASALGQAILVVVLSSLAGGLGSISVNGVGGIISGIFVALIGWLIWAIIVFLIGTKVLPQPQTSADLGQLLRTLGFSASPGIIRIVGIIPFLYGLVNLVATIWMFVAMVIAVKQALDYDNYLRAVGVCLIGFLVYVIFAAIFGGSLYFLSS